jgi:pimeloyl-ACP methyl ester carboxylesterase
MEIQDLLKTVCSPGTETAVKMVPVSEKVSLRLFSFTPKSKRKKPDIVFVAGWITQIDSWGEVLKEMTERHRVYYIETREKISSEVKGRVSYGAEAMGEDTAATVAHLGLKDDEYILFGSSLGATAILDGYKHLKTKPKSLALIAPNAVFRIPLFWRLVILAFIPPAYFILKPIIKWYLRTFRMDIESDRAQYEKYARNLEAADPWKLKRAAIALWKYQVWDELEGIDVPVLIVGGSKDTLHEPENLRKMTELLPDATYLDMETNKMTHSREMVQKMWEFIKKH